MEPTFARTLCVAFPPKITFLEKTLVATLSLSLNLLSFKRLANQGRYKRFIARVAIELERKQTLSSGCALGLGSFTAMNPWPRAIIIVEYNNIIVLQYN